MGPCPASIQTLSQTNPPEQKKAAALSLIIGLIAATAWAFHDLCVRYVSQKIRILPALLAVQLFGALLLAPVALASGHWGAMTLSAYLFSGLSGLAFALGSLCLYGAFFIGPVRLVAPVIGAYPILSVGWGAFGETPISLIQWGAVLLIVVGVALVATLSDDRQEGTDKTRAILLAIGAGAGFAVTFAAGQTAVRLGPELPTIFTSRMIGVIAIGGLMLITRHSFRPEPALLPLLALMGLLDVTALGLVTAAGALLHPEFAAVSSSLFGILTVVLAWAILNEPMTRQQWGAVILVFCGIAYLGL